MSVERVYNKIQLLLLDMGELNAIDLLQYTVMIECGLLTKNGVYLNSLSSLNEFVMPTRSKNMS